MPVAYSLGNFWFSTGTLYTTLAKITITEDGAVTLSYVPCIQKGLVTSILTEQDDKDGFIITWLQFPMTSEWMRTVMFMIKQRGLPCADNRVRFGYKQDGDSRHDR